MLIRRAELHDLDSVLVLCKEFSTSFVVEESAFRQSYAALLAQPDAYLAIAQEESEIIGYVLGFDHYALYANGRVCWVEEIMVRQAQRRQGLGRRLMNAVEQWALERGARLVSLATRRAAPFYLALGYEESATYFRKQLQK